MRMRVWMVVCMEVMVTMGVYGNEKNHNGDEHDRLCKVLSAAVTALQTNSLSNTLKEALYITIFGNKSGGSLDALKGSLPVDYNDEKGKSRANVCGQPPNVGSRDHQQPRWPGHSAPHDLVCLCTPGNDGWPFGESIPGKKKLCGREKSALEIAEGNKGWSSSGNGEEGKKQMQETWNTIAKKCLGGDAGGNDLKEALHDFLRNLHKQSFDKYQERYRLGEDKEDPYPCSGNKKICVMYYNTTEANYPMPWWTELQMAIKNDDELQPKKKREEEINKQENSQKQRQTQKQDQTQLPHTHRTAALQSAQQGSQEAEPDNTENNPNPIATLEETSGTLIIPPSSWLFNALLLI
ncbi:Variant surface glycoprotein [Trypanosoma congolense IL3000]|uniref:Variant surface glycoprotein n=1 Tax=Trypanosoma congolense (strain IL3000) TaxID=1068625 RepID=F9W4M6_TRYCI|nr:Variant surface glycoprotein [Trypanosoma congolense IL3000]